MNFEDIQYKRMLVWFLSRLEPRYYDEHDLVQDQFEEVFSDILSPKTAVIAEPEPEPEIVETSFGGRKISRNKSKSKGTSTSKGTSKRKGKGKSTSKGKGKKTRSKNKGKK